MLENQLSLCVRVGPYPTCPMKSWASDKYSLQQSSAFCLSTGIPAKYRCKIQVLLQIYYQKGPGPKYRLSVTCGDAVRPVELIQNNVFSFIQIITWTTIQKCILNSQMLWARLKVAWKAPGKGTRQSHQIKGPGKRSRKKHQVKEVNVPYASLGHEEALTSGRVTNKGAE